MHPRNPYKLLTDIWKGIQALTLNFQRLETDVSNLTSVTQSVVTLLNSIAQEIRDSAANQAKLEELATKIESNATALSDAVVANTPTPPQT